MHQLMEESLFYLRPRGGGTRLIGVAKKNLTSTVASLAAKGRVLRELVPLLNLINMWAYPYLKGDFQTEMILVGVKSSVF